MKSLKTKVSITLDTDLLEIVKGLAEQDDRSLSQYIKLVLKEHLKKPKNNRGCVINASFNHTEQYNPIINWDP